ncbi:hypothetical protein ACQJ0Y_14505 [Peribacillus simplex]|uniref:hypothetical protein n=1 Tax=Peribacillus simplex TaxID=1478 RepID=UPI003CF697A6
MSTLFAEKEQLNARAERELGRFFSLAGMGVNNLVMPAGVIDEVWHNKLKNQEEYTEFCNETAGGHITHAPMKGEGEIKWVPEYEKQFGKLDPAWFTKETGEVDKPKYEAYLRDGKVSMEWDCVPIQTDN